MWDSVRILLRNHDFIQVDFAFTPVPVRVPVRSSPVPLAFTPGKIDWNGSGCVTRSHLFRNATGTQPERAVRLTHHTSPPQHTCALIQHGCLACRVLLSAAPDSVVYDI